MAIVYDKPIEDFWDWWTAAGRAAAEAGMRDCAFDAFDRAWPLVSRSCPGCVLQLALVGPEAVSDAPGAVRVLWP